MHRPLIEGDPTGLAFRRELETAADAAALRRELEERLAARRDPFAAAEAFSVHDLLDPRETRPALCRWLEWSRPLLEPLRGPRAYGIRP